MSVLSAMQKNMLDTLIWKIGWICHVGEANRGVRVKQASIHHRPYFAAKFLLGHSMVKYVC